MTTNFFFFFPEVSLSHQEKKRCLNFNLFLVIYITNNKLLVNQARRFNNFDDGIILYYSLFPGLSTFFCIGEKIFLLAFVSVNLRKNYSLPSGGYVVGEKISIQ